MAAPLAVCIKEEERAVIQFLWLEGVPGAEIHRRLSTQYGDNALPHRSVYEWIEKFKNGRTNMTHDEGAGRPSTSTIDEKIQQAREMVLANRRVAIDEVACSLQISHGSAYQIIHDELGFHKLCARWVPKEHHLSRGRLSLEYLLRWRSRVFPLQTLPFGFWLIVMDPRFVCCDYSAQKFLAFIIVAVE